MFKRGDIVRYRPNKAYPKAHHLLDAGVMGILKRGETDNPLDTDGYEYVSTRAKYIYYPNEIEWVGPEPVHVTRFCVNDFEFLGHIDE